MKKAIVFLMTAVMLAGILCGCTPKDTNANKEFKLTVSGIGGSLLHLPAYIAEEKGFFAKEGLEIETVYFTGGPIQMEALSADSWDIGITGIGGTLAGPIGYDAVIVAPSNTDVTSYAFVRTGSEIDQAGAGNNTNGDKVLGTPETWKGKTILCSSGTVLQYLMSKTLEGFGLTSEDVEVIFMDGQTIKSAFIAGEGDVAFLTGAQGAFDMMNDPEYKVASNGTYVNIGLMCNILANPKSYANPEKFKAMEVFTRVFFETAEWIDDNKEEAAQLLLAFTEQYGAAMEPKLAAEYLTSEHFYTLEEAYNMMTTKAAGSDLSQMDYDLTNALQFFIDSGNYTPEDLDRFAGKSDTALIEAVHGK